MKKPVKTADATREAFVSAFFQLARKKKISQIKVHEITDLAGYDRTTFYRYFEDIYDLIEYGEDEFLQKIKKVIEEKCSGAVVGERLFFETLIQCFRENKDRVSILLSEENRSHFLRKISENIANSPYQPYKNNPKKMVTRDIYFFGIFHAISVNLESKDALPDDDLLDIIQKLFDNWYWPEMKSRD